MKAAEIDALRAEALEACESADTAETIEAVRVRYLGRKGLLPSLMKGLKALEPEDRAPAGAAANRLKTELLGALDSRQQSIAASGDSVRKLDWSLPGDWPRLGTLHPITRIIEEVVAVFARLGFTVAEGPEIETPYHNFEALNTPSHHPSLDPQDTFWLGTDSLLRTQTSPVQIRVMQAMQPPVRVVTPGRCYRRDTTDATHSANFHQIEGLYVDREVSLADLKGTLTYFARHVMGPDVGVRFRPHFFPFTEPSVEVDFSCHVCSGSGCRVCKQSGWIEIAGAGMVDPRVFQKVGYDAERYMGFAFGMGIERIAMIKYGVPDIRLLYENDLRFLEQFRGAL